MIVRTPLYTHIACLVIYGRECVYCAVRVESLTIIQVSVGFSRINTVCLTRYRTRHFFNNFTTNEDIAQKFEADLPHCVRNVTISLHMLFKFRCNIFIGVRFIKEMPGSVASGTYCINKSQQRERGRQLIGFYCLGCVFEYPGIGVLLSARIEVVRTGSGIPLASYPMEPGTYSVGSKAVGE